MKCYYTIKTRKDKFMKAEKKDFRNAVDEAIVEESFKEGSVAKEIKTALEQAIEYEKCNSTV